MKEQTNTLKKPLGNQSLIDLGVGNPVFMQEYWNLVAKAYPNGLGQSSLKVDEFMDYDYGQSNQNIKRLIKELHNEEQNAKTDGYEVVLGNGAAQVVAAASYAAAKMGAMYAFLPKPYWGRMKTLIQMGGNVAGVSEFLVSASLLDELQGPSSEVLVYPNNPDMSLVHNTAMADHSIFDLCYNWKHYVSNVKCMAKDVMIFGLAKATGHAGTRLGWALVKNKVFAQHMVKFIELTTSGVSQEAQNRTETILNTIKQLRRVEFLSPFDYGKAEMSQRWARFNRVADSHITEFEIVNSEGMFAWCRHANQESAKIMADQYGLYVLGGEPFGSTSDYFRINMGCSKDSFDKMISSLEVK